MTESTKEKASASPAKFYCRESDLQRVAQEGEGNVFIVGGSRPFADWTEIGRRAAAGTSQAGLEEIADVLAEDGYPEFSATVRALAEQVSSGSKAGGGNTIAHQAGVIPEGMPEAEYWRQEASKSAARVLVLKREKEALERRLATAQTDASVLTLEEVQDRAAHFRRVLMPMHLTREMIEIISENEWKWEDLLAAAEAVTEPQYEEIASGGPAFDRLRDLVLEWNEAFVAFKGAFDTPHIRLQMNDDYANDARSRLRGFDESLAALTAETKKGDDVRLLVNALCNDLLDCAAVLFDDGQFKEQAIEIRRVVVELRAACRISPLVAGQDATGAGAGADESADIGPSAQSTDPLADKAYWESQGQVEQLNSNKD